MTSIPSKCELEDLVCSYLHNSFLHTHECQPLLPGTSIYTYKTLTSTVKTVKTVGKAEKLVGKNGE